MGRKPRLRVGTSRIKTTEQDGGNREASQEPVCSKTSKCKTHRSFLHWRNASTVHCPLCHQLASALSGQSARIPSVVPFDHLCLRLSINLNLTTTRPPGGQECTLRCGGPPWCLLSAPLLSGTWRCALAGLSSVQRPALRTLHQLLCS